MLFVYNVRLQNFNFFEVEIYLMELKEIVNKMKKSFKQNERDKRRGKSNVEFKIYKLNSNINLNENLEINNATNNNVNFFQSPQESIQNCKLGFVNVNDKNDHVEVDFEKFIVKREKKLLNNSTSHFFQLL